MATLPPIDESFEVLAQVKPAPNTLIDALVVDDNEQNIISSIAIANHGRDQDSYWLSIALEGTTDDLPEQYFAVDVPINGRDTFAATLGKTLNGTDILRFKSAGGNLSLTIWGVRLIPV